MARPKGSQNKMTVALKDLILGALNKAGGENYLKKQAMKNPAAFMALVGRVLPLQMKADNSDPMMPARVIHEYYDKPPSDKV